MLGTAGFKREMAIVATSKPSAETAKIMMRRLRFFAATPTRGTSIDERFDANPAGRTIVSSFGFRCGITVGSKPECLAKLHDGMFAAHESHRGRDDHRGEQDRFANEITPRLLLKIMATDIADRGRHRCCASALITVERHCAVMPVDQRKLVFALVRPEYRFH